jgi:hypothetical protein
MAVGETTVGAAEAPQAGQIPVSSSRKTARAQACARGTSVSMRRNSSGVISARLAERLGRLGIAVSRTQRGLI